MYYFVAIKILYNLPNHSGFYKRKFYFENYLLKIVEKISKTAVKLFESGKGREGFLHAGLSMYISCKRRYVPASLIDFLLIFWDKNKTSIPSPPFYSYSNNFLKDFWNFLQTSNFIEKIPAADSLPFHPSLSPLPSQCWSDFLLVTRDSSICLSFLPAQMRSGSI